MLVLAPQARARSPRGQLEEIESELRAERGELKQLAGEEKGVLATLEAAEQAVRDAEAEATAAQAALAAAEVKAEDTSSARAAGDARVRALRTRALPRLLARYKLGQQGYLRLLLSAEGPHDLRRRQRLLSSVVQSDLERLRALRVENERAVQLAAESENARAEADAAARVVVERVEQTALLRVEHEEALAAVREAKLLGEQAVKELDKARADLKALIARLPAAPMAPDDPFEDIAGRLPMPVRGRIEVPFGRRVDPRFNTITLQKGWDIRAATAAPVAVVHGGTVVHAGWFRGYGLLVIVDHGGGFYTLYAHLGEIRAAVSTELEAGEVLGTVGDTGSLKGPFLYFEIRRGPEPEDPARWVAGARLPVP